MELLASRKAMLSQLNIDVITAVDYRQLRICRVRAITRSRYKQRIEDESNCVNVSHDGGTGEISFRLTELVFKNYFIF